MEGFVRQKDIPFEGFPFFVRSPRIMRVTTPETITIQAPPCKESMSKNSLLQIIMPPLVMIAVSVFMGVYMRRGLFVIGSICMSGVTVIFSIYRFFSERRELKEKNTKRINSYTDYLIRLRKYIRIKRKNELETMRYRFPDVNKLYQMATEYDCRMYENSIEDEDFMLVTLGSYTGESCIRVECKSDGFETEPDELMNDAKELCDDFAHIDGIPVTVSLCNENLGIVGNKENVHNEIKYLISQLCFFNSYHDMQIVFICDDADKKEFSYLRWYPHMRIQSINAVAFIHNARIRDQILGTVMQIIKERQLRHDESNKGIRFSPQILFIIDAPETINGHAIMEYLGEQPAVLGVSIIYTANMVSKLPQNIHTVCVLDDSDRGRILIRDGIHINREFDLVSVKDINVEKMSRRCAAIVHEQATVSSIPESMTFLNMYHADTPAELNVTERWKNHEAHKSLTVPIGVREQDNYVELDIHERAHGPHGLVAGTTGSGKSEIVQSYILSLAVNFHPYEVAFLLIDYKGGGMANLFDGLPHLLGTITNLDGTESIRALVSIKSELARRQRIFGENHVNHINGYHQLFKQGKVTEPLPHLLIISDEFAELKKEQPEFMKELVSTARIGRSLGVHLILATQKPSGVVDDQIWTNSKFKLCLKVQDEADSREMIGTNDAALITQPGRAYLQVGNNEIYELFQSAYSGGAYEADGEQRSKDDRVYLINEVGQGELINRDLGGTIEDNSVKKTELDVIVDHIRRIFDDMNIPMVKSPWLPPLTSVMVSPEFTKVHNSVDFLTSMDLTAYIGVEDVPEEQRQSTYTHDFIKDSHIIYIASSGYGKTVFVETILLSLCIKNSVSNLNAYIVDLGNSALLPCKALPQVADYISYDDAEKQDKLWKLLANETRTRKQLMAKSMSQNISIYNQSNPDKLKAILLIVDNYDAIKELDIDENFFVQLAREGANLGIYMVITASRSSVVKYALMNQIKTKVAGYNFEPTEPRTIIGRSDYTLPEIQGRALVKTGSINLMQVFSPVEYITDLDYNNRLKDLVSRIIEMSTEDKASGIPVLPEQLYLNMLSGYKTLGDADIWLGLEKQSVRAVGIQVTHSPFLIVGPVQSGKSNAGRVIISQLPDYSHVYIFDNEDYEYQYAEDMSNVTYVNREEKVGKTMESISAIIAVRKKECEEKRGRQRIDSFYHSLDKYCIIINGADDFMSLTNDDSSVIRIIEEASDVGMLVIVIAHSSHIPARSEITRLIKKCESGLILGDAGMNTPFPTFRSKDLPERVEDGILYLKGSSCMIRIIEG